MKYCEQYCEQKTKIDRLVHVTSIKWKKEMKKKSIDIIIG